MQVIALSLEKIWGKEDFFCTNPPHSTHNLKKIIMAKWYLSQNQQHQRPFSVKEGMWVKREFFMNCKSRENGVRPILSFFPQTRVHPLYLPFPYPFLLCISLVLMYVGRAKGKGHSQSTFYRDTGLGRFSRFTFLKLLAFPFIVEVRFIFLSFTRGKSLFTAKIEVCTPTLGQTDEESLGEFYNRQNVAVETLQVNSSAHCFHPRHLRAKSLLCLVYLLKLFQDYGFFSM